MASARLVVVLLGAVAGVAAQAEVAAFDAAFRELLAATEAPEQVRRATVASSCFLRLEPGRSRQQRLAQGMQANVLAGRPAIALEIAAFARPATAAPEVVRWRLHALARTGQLAAFVALAEASNAASPGLVDAVYAAEEQRLLPLADGALRRGEADLGRAVFTTLAALQPAQAWRYANLGLCLRNLGDLDAAERAYRRGRELAKGDAQVENDWGLFLRATGRADAALAAFRRSLALDTAVPGGRAGQGPGVTNLLHLEALRAGSAGADPLPPSRRALAVRPDARMLRRLVLDVGLDRLCGRGPRASDR